MGPRVANTELYARLTAKAQELSLARALPDLIGSLEGSPDSLRRLADALGTVADFDLLVIRLQYGDESGTVRSIPMYRPDAIPDPALSQFLETLPGNHQWTGKRPGDARSVLVPDLRAARGESFQNELLGFGFKICLHLFLRSKADSFGILSLYSRRPSGFDVSTRRTLEGLTAHVAPIVQHSRLNRETQELAFLDDMARVLASPRRLEEVFGHVAGAFNKLIAFDGATLSWLDPNGYDIDTIGWRRGLGSRESLSQEERPAFRTQTNLRFRNKAIGTLALSRDKEGAFSAREQGTLERLGNQIAPIIQNIRLYHQARRQAYQLRQSNRTQQSGIGYSNHGSSAQGILDAMVAHLGAAGRAYTCTAKMTWHWYWRPVLRPPPAFSPRAFPMSCLGWWTAALVPANPRFCIRSLARGNRLRARWTNLKMVIAIWRYPCQGRWAPSESWCWPDKALLAGIPRS